MEGWAVRGSWSVDGDGGEVEDEMSERKERKSASACSSRVRVLGFG